MAQHLGIWAWPQVFGEGVCALAGCGKAYKKRGWDQKYCCREHEKRANNARHSERDKERRKQRRKACQSVK